MKKLCTVFIFTAALQLGAQPVLHDVAFIEGLDIYNLVTSDSVINEGSGGADQAWDFTGLTTLDDAQIFTGMDIFSTPYVYDFPDANLAARYFNYFGDETFSYFRNDDTTYTFWGFASEAGASYLSDGRDIMHYPFTMGDSFHDTYYASAGIGYNSGTVDISADGYGTVMLSSGDFPNCLRVREVRMDTIEGEVLFYTTIDTSYRYYLDGHPEPLVQVNYHHGSDGLTVKEIYWQNFDQGVVHDYKDQLRLFPVPCSDLLQVTLKNGSVAGDIEIFDVTGRKMEFTFSINKNIISVNTAGLISGYYLCRVSSGDKMINAGFIKE